MGEYAHGRPLLAPLQRYNSMAQAPGTRKADAKGEHGPAVGTCTDGGDRRLVALLVFKTSVGPEEGPGWVRFPFTSAIFSGTDRAGTLSWRTRILHLPAGVKRKAAWKVTRRARAAGSSAPHLLL